MRLLFNYLAGLPYVLQMMVLFAAVVFLYWLHSNLNRLLIKAYFLDTGDVKLVWFPKSTFNRGKNLYAINRQLLYAKNILFYDSRFCEPTAIEEDTEVSKGLFKKKKNNKDGAIQPIRLDPADESLWRYRTLSKEYFTTYHNQVVKTMFITRTQDLITRIFYGVLGTFIICAFVAYKVASVWGFP